MTDGTILSPPGNGTTLSIGDIDGLGDLGYIIGGGGSIYQLNAAGTGFSNGYASGNSGFVDFILADLLGNDGIDEIYAVKSDGVLWRFDSTISGDFEIVQTPEPGTIILTLTGLAGIALIRHRVRRRGNKLDK